MYRNYDEYENDLKKYQDEVCQIPASKIYPKFEESGKFKHWTYEKPCGVKYALTDEIHCGKWKEQTCEYLNTISGKSKIDFYKNIKIQKLAEKIYKEIIGENNDSSD